MHCIHGSNFDWEPTWQTRLHFLPVNIDGIPKLLKVHPTSTTYIVASHIPNGTVTISRSCAVKMTLLYPHSPQFFRNDQGLHRAGATALLLTLHPVAARIRFPPAVAAARSSADFCSLKLMDFM